MSLIDTWEQGAPGQIFFSLLVRIMAQKHRQPRLNNLITQFPIQETAGLPCNLVEAESTRKNSIWQLMLNNNHHGTNTPRSFTSVFRGYGKIMKQSEQQTAGISVSMAILKRHLQYMSRGARKNVQWPCFWQYYFWMSPAD